MIIGIGVIRKRSRVGGTVEDWEEGRDPVYITEIVVSRETGFSKGY